MFDSGIGGLTVLKEVRRLLPEEDIIYFGDTARVPYGNRSPQTVTKYALESALFLLTRGIKILVVACNTSSALALSVLKKKLPVPVLGVIEPGAREAVSRKGVRRIGVIGTRATIRSHAYEEAIRRLNPDVEVLSAACPLFVPIVEEGLEGDPVARLMADRYLLSLKEAAVDVLVMGCTHYPMLEPVIAETMGDGVTIVHTGKETAKEVRTTLENHGTLRKSRKGKTEYFVTDSPYAFAGIGSRFLEEQITHIKFVKDLDYRNVRITP